MRLNKRIGAQLDDEQATNLLNELFNDWFRQRVNQLLNGQAAAPLPLGLLEDAQGLSSEP